MGDDDQRDASGAEEQSGSDEAGDESTPGVIPTSCQTCKTKGSAAEK